MTDYHANFIKALINKSDEKQDYFEAIKEWVFYGEVYDKKSVCVCGHLIVENCIIHNTQNGNTLITGNCCINKVAGERRHANKSRSNYFELAETNCKNVGERDFVLRLGCDFRRYNMIYFNSINERKALERITGLPYRFKSSVFRRREV